MICFPNIKINLGLRIINRRTDGFHTIESVFYPIKFADILEVIPTTSAEPQVHFHSSGLPIAGNANDNLIVKAYYLLAESHQLPPIEIHLHKIIPMGAGLGGGSSDAAFMLNLLNQQFELQLSLEQLENYAAQLGSDCAFFIQNKPAYLLGKGHELEPYDLNLAGYYLVLLYASVHSNTALAYQNVKPRMVFDENTSLNALLKLPVSEWKHRIENDFESSVFEQFPILATLKNELYQQGAMYASMSGSGSAVFGIFAQKPQLTEQLRSVVCFEGWL
jgi:4-diphosphocytidyl-2-C-methyl-D-erythritol kinase